MTPDPGMRTATEEPLEHIARLEQDLARLQDQLIRSERLATLGTMVAAIAHEFNNILTPVMSYTEMALGSPADDPLREKALHKAHDGAARAAKISQALLGFTSGDEHDDATANVSQVVRNAIDCLPREPQRDGVETDIEIPADLNASIRPVALQQVLVNLLMNAVEAMKPQGGVLRLKADRSTWNEIRLSVSDSGPGIDEAVARQLFAPFTSAKFKRGSQSGAGLGLSICKHLIEAAGGTIHAGASVDGGAEFQITLPAP